VEVKRRKVRQDLTAGALQFSGNLKPLGCWEISLEPLFNVQQRIGSAALHKGSAAATNER
jgi:hypothetical protein